MAFGLAIIILVAIVLIALVIVGYLVSIYNGLVTLKNNIKKSWANIDVLLKQSLQSSLAKGEQARPAPEAGLPVCRLVDRARWTASPPIWFPWMAFHWKKTGEVRERLQALLPAQV